MKKLVFLAPLKTCKKIINALAKFSDRNSIRANPRDS